MPENAVLAKNLKEIRKQLHESQMEFAAHCGISTEELSLLERERSNPQLSTIQKVAAYTDRTVANLLQTE